MNSKSFTSNFRTSYLLFFRDVVHSSGLWRPLEKKCLAEQNCVIWLFKLFTYIDYILFNRMSSRYVLRNLRVVCKPRVQCFAGLAPRANLSTALLRKAHHPHYPAVNITHSIQRHVATAEKKFECFNIQDAADFQTRVMESPVPVVVDFHAT